MTMEVYTNWEKVPPHLKTRTALKKMGLKPKRGAQPVAIKESTWRSRVSNYDLYDVREAVPNKLSEAQRMAIKKAQAASEQSRTCKGCGRVMPINPTGRGYWGLDGDGYCPMCAEAQQVQVSRQEAIHWAARIIECLADGTIAADEVLILDSETTVLHGEIIELAIINLRGEVKYNQRFKPTQMIAPEAAAVHGLTADLLEEEPDFASEWPTIKALIEGARLVLIYNASYDVYCLDKTCALHECKPIPMTTECLMEWYAQFVGDWSDYHQDFRWQPLPGGDHSALGDCQAALEVLRTMAEAGG